MVSYRYVDTKRFLETDEYVEREDIEYTIIGKLLLLVRFSNKDFCFHINRGSRKINYSKMVD